MSRPERWRKLALLLSLYVCQGMPFGFQTRALPLYLRESGMSLAGIGFLGLLSLPWVLKLLWAPLVDRYGSARLGRRKSWILPTQAGLVLSASAAAFVSPKEQLPLLLALVFVMNLFAAAQDVAVDALAVDLLRGREFGFGNAAQVAGYKVGMLFAGTLLVGLSGSLGWIVVFGGIALATSAVLLFVGFTPEPEPVRGAAHPGASPGERLAFREILGLMGRALRLPGAAWLIAFVATFDAGETLVDRMFKHFLQDAGFTSAWLGWLGGPAMAASILGSVVGGVLPTKVGLYRALVIAGVLRAFAVAAEWLLALHGAPTGGMVIAVSIVEHFCGGMLTTAVFAFMMSRVDPRIGATHYTLFATAELAGKALVSNPSGLLAERLGYADLFLVGTVLSFAFLALLVPVRRMALAAEAPARTTPA